MSPNPKILFLHLNHRAQFEFFGRYLAREGWDVSFAHRAPENTPQGARDADGIRTFHFFPQPTGRPEGDFRHILDLAAENARAAAELFLWLRDEKGYAPDLVIAHVGWGVGLCVREVWPRARYIAYHEWFYTNLDWDRGNKVERPVTLGALVSSRLRNLPISAEFDAADANWCPTPFQASRFPPPLRGLLDVVPDGTDCALHCPDPDARPEGVIEGLPAGRKLLTYATRGMEPIRGFPQFMRALEVLQARRGDFDTAVLAQDTVAYGDKLPEGDSWQARALAALSLDRERLHLLGMRPRAEYIRVLQASDAHVYFTEPFVTSWSLAEAMACGCLVIGSTTAPLRDFVRDMETGILVDMDDPEEVAEMIGWAFDHPAEVARIRAAARAEILARADAAQVFPQKRARLEALLRGGTG